MEEERKQEDDQEAQGDSTNKEEAPAYDSRLITCSRCEAQQETKWMQLRSLEGYRALHCKDCKKQERCSRSKCQCGQIWHQCPLHRIDPPTHSSRKRRKIGHQHNGSKSKKDEVVISSKRKAPEIHDAKPPLPLAIKKNEGEPGWIGLLATNG